MLWLGRVPVYVGGFGVSMLGVNRKVSSGIGRSCQTLYPLLRMSYHTAFDVAQMGFQWWPSLLIALGALLAAVIGWAIKNLGGDENDNVGGLYLQFGGIAGLIGSAAFLAFTYSEYRSAVQALSSRHYSIASGIVTNFIPMHCKGCTEGFTVNGVRFEYGTGFSSAVFGSIWNKGSIRNGVDAKITYSRDHDILRVEVR